MNINEIEGTIIPFLTSTGRYSTLIAQFQSLKTKGHAFELYFAYTMEQGGIQLEYEKNASEDGEKTVDFYYNHNGKDVWFELVSPDINQELKDNIEQQLKDTKSDGISYYQLALTSNHTNPNYNSDAQLIRLQEKILEKPSKFSTPSDNSFNVIVADCSTAFIHKIDAEDFRNLTYGYANEPHYQAWFNGKRINGLLENGFKKNGSEELQNKLSALLCLGKVNLNLFNTKHAYISCNPLLEEHYNKAFNCLREIAPLNMSRYINPIKPNNSDDTK